jgi:RNA polymerase primary sigma factor
METEQQKRLKALVLLGKERGYLNFQELSDYVPIDTVEREHIKDIISMLNDMGIKVHEEAANDDK